MNAPTGLEWPITSDLAEHRKSIEAGLEIINNHLELPADGRYNYAFGALAVGGQLLGVDALGETGTGKTEFGNLVLGSRTRVELQGDDLEGKIFGQSNPVNSADFVPGRLKNIDPDDPRFFLNELRNLRRNRVMGQLVEASNVEINRQDVDITNSVLYVTGNFPYATDGTFPLSPNLRSRLAMQILAGDVTADQLSAIHEREPNIGSRDSEHLGLIGGPKARLSLREALDVQMPTNSQEFRGMTEGVMKKLAALEVDGEPVIAPFAISDSRNVGSWKWAAKVSRFMRGKPRTEKGEGVVGAFDAYAVASLVLPTVIDLSYVGRDILTSAAGSFSHNPLVEAIAVRSLIEEIAFETYIDVLSSSPDTDSDIVSALTTVKNEKTARSAYREKYTFATPGQHTSTVNGFMDKVIDDTTSKVADKPAKGDDAKSHRRFRRHR